MKITAHLRSSTYDALHFAQAQSTMPYYEFIDGIITLGLAILGNQHREAQQAYDHMHALLRNDEPAVDKA